MPITITSRFLSLRESVWANCDSRSLGTFLAHSVPWQTASASTARNKGAVPISLHQRARLLPLRGHPLARRLPDPLPDYSRFNWLVRHYLGFIEAGLCIKDETGSQDVVAVFIMGTTSGIPANPRYKAGA